MTVTQMAVYTGMKSRIHTAELLDEGRGSDGDVAASLADLRRINRYLGGRRVLLQLLDEQLRRTGLAGSEFAVLDAGAGSCDLPTAIVRRHPGARVIAADVHLRHLRQAAAMNGTRKAALQRVCADVHRLPFPERAFDFVTLSLFLHHFDDEGAAGLLRGLAKHARRAVLVNDLDRHWVPLAFVGMTAPVFARSPITRFDAPASIRAGFGRGELAAIAARAGFRGARERWHFPFRRSVVIEVA